MAVKKWNEMSADEQAAENAAREKAKGARRAAEKASLEKEIKGQPKKGKELKKAAKTVDVNTDTKVLSKPVSADTAAPKSAIDVPQSDSRAFDFEKVASAKSKLNLVTSDAPTEVPTKPYNLGLGIPGAEQKPKVGKLAKAAKAAKSPKVELPGAKSTAAPELPDRPLPGQGSRADKPVEKVVVKVSDRIMTKEGVAKWNAAKDAERRITQGSAPEAERRAAVQAQKVMTPSGAIEGAAPAASDPFATMREAGKRGFGAVQAQVDDSVREAYKASTQMGKRVGQSLAEKAGAFTAKGAKTIASQSGKALLGTAKAATEPLWKPIAEFAAGHAGRAAAYTAAEEATKAAASGGLKAKMAARGLGAIATARTAGAVGLMGGRLALGGAKMAGEGIAAAALWDVGAKGEAARAASTSTIHGLKSSGAKQGLQVTAPEPSIWRMGLGASPKIKVHDPSQDVDLSTGKSLSQKRREQGEAKLKANTSAKDDTFSEVDYEKLKKLASRNTIKGSYNG